VPNDSVFGDIKKRLKYHPEVYVPKHWYDIIAESRSGAKPFFVHQMKKEDFNSTATLETAIVDRKTNVDGQKVNWFEMRQIEVRRTDPMSLFYKTSHNPEEEWKQIDLAQRGRSTAVSGITQMRLYEGTRAINPLKKIDLISMLHLVSSISQLAKLHAVTALKDWRSQTLNWKISRFLRLDSCILQLSLMLHDVDSRAFY